MFSMLPYSFYLLLLTAVHWSVHKHLPFKRCISAKDADMFRGKCWAVSDLFYPSVKVFFQQEVTQRYPCLHTPSWKVHKLCLCVRQKHWHASKSWVRSQQFSLWVSEAELGNNMQMPSRKRRKKCLEDDVWIQCLQTGSRKQFVLWPDMAKNSFMPKGFLALSKIHLLCFAFLIYSVRQGLCDLPLVERWTRWSCKIIFFSSIQFLFWILYLGFYSKSTYLQIEKSFACFQFSCFYMVVKSQLKSYGTKRWFIK